MFLENLNIALRAIEPGDIDYILNIENDSRLWHLSNTYNPFSRFDIEQYVMSADKDIYTSKQLRLIIKNKKTGNYCGIVDVFDFDAHNSRAGVGIIVENELRLSGIGEQSLDLLIDYMFNRLNINQLFCNIEADNTGSIRLFEKKGFLKTGEKKEWNRKNELFVDEYFYQLIRNKN